ncbi:hypothetical protein [Methanomethylophilus alvi]|uniref:hypothetical protein n=1 Tax=Methanomethylophilus alvi TaxID=1291540 RepID=UPI0037DD876A
MMESTHGRRSKSLAIGAVALLMAMSAFVMLSADDSDALGNYGTESDPLTSLSCDFQEIAGSSTIYIAVGSPVTISNGEGIRATSVSSGFGLSINAEGDLTGTLSKSGTIIVATYDDMYEESCAGFVIKSIDTVKWNVSDITVYAGQAISITPVASGTVSVSGVGWLSASGNCVFGTAPSENGVYDVTVSCGGSSASFKITVISALAFASIPSSGIFAYEG